jgi:polyisoprenoid-binding protein YceI
MKSMKILSQVTMVLFLGASIISCKQENAEKASTSEATEAAQASGVEYTIDAAASQINWEGSKPTGTHTGTVNLTEGSVSVEDGLISGGSFTIDMNTITVTDLTGDEKGYLEGHLKGTEDKNRDDFFNVSTYPTAKFEITKVTKLVNNPEHTHLIYGNLTLRDVTKEVGFNAVVKMNDEKMEVSTPKFTIDRTEWGVKYGSTKFFDNLKDKFINDDIGLQINVVATANPS